jgi:membrane dipeptidase
MKPTPISRRAFTQSAAAATLTPGIAQQLLSAPASPVSAESPTSVWPGYSDAMVIDCLATPGPFNVPRMFDAPFTPTMIANAKASGITAVNMTLAAGGNGPGAFLGAVRSLAFAERELTAWPDVLTRIRTVADLERARRERKCGLIYGFQDGTALEDDITRVELFHSLGVRIIQLTYNVRNLLGDGCLEKSNGGLSAFGRRVVAEMNRLGILVDLSHVGERTTNEAIAASTKPVAFTHSGCQAVNGVPRNKTDAQLKAFAEKGGVIGIFLMPFLRGAGQPSADDFATHIEHAIRVCGEEHVGIGSDLSITPLELTPDFRQTHADFVRVRREQGISAPGEAEDVFNYVPDFNTPRRMDQIADLLAKRGHGSARIAKILGGNWMRLFGEVWR